MYGTLQKQQQRHHIQIGFNYWCLTCLRVEVNLFSALISNSLGISQYGFRCLLEIERLLFSLTYGNERIV